MAELIQQAGYNARPYGAENARKWLRDMGADNRTKAGIKINKTIEKRQTAVWIGVREIGKATPFDGVAATRPFKTNAHD